MEAEKPAGKRQRTEYNAAFRTKAVRRVTQDGQAATRVAQALGMSETVLGKWVRAARSQAARPAGSQALEPENKHLRAQLARAERERAILKKRCRYFHNRRADETLRFRCPTCSLRARAAAGPIAGRQFPRLLRVAKARPRCRRRAGAPRLASGGPTRLLRPRRPLGPAPTARPTAARRPRGVPAAVARLAPRQRLTGPVQPRQFPPPPRTTRADPRAVAAANKLASWPAATAPHQTWVGDSAYLALATGHWAYPAGRRDAVERRVVGRHMVGRHVSKSLHTDLMLNAFNRAVAVCQPPPGLLVHADRGRQYPSTAFTRLLDRTRAIARLSRPGNPDDNALAERGWSILQTEPLPRGSGFADLEEARFELAAYLDHYYNTPRLHSTLGDCTPLEIELHYFFNNLP